MSNDGIPQQHRDIVDAALRPYGFANGKYGDLPYTLNDRLLCYEMTYNGGNYLFIQTKKAVSTVVDLPAGYTNHVYSVWHTDKTQSATTHSGKAPIKLVSKGPGTTILKIEN